MRRSVTWRGFALLWAVLQFALPGVALHADARLERASLESPGSHVESGSSRACPPVHRDECALCNLVSRSAEAAPATAGPPIAATVRPCVPTPIVRPATRAAAAASLPRAPPSVG